MKSKEWRHYIRGLAQNSRPDDMENVLLIDFEAAEQRIKELEGLLREYGRHNLGCSGEFPQHKCKCGWDEISAVFAQSEQAEWVCAACGVSHPGKVCPQFKYTEEE